MLIALIVLIHWSLVGHLDIFNLSCVLLLTHPHPVSSFITHPHPLSSSHSSPPAIHLSLIPTCRSPCTPPHSPSPFLTHPHPVSSFFHSYSTQRPPFSLIPTQRPPFSLISIQQLPCTHLHLAASFHSSPSGILLSLIPIHHSPFSLIPIHRPFLLIPIHQSPFLSSLSSVLLIYTSPSRRPPFTHPHLASSFYSCPLNPSASLFLVFIVYLQCFLLLLYCTSATIRE